MSDYLQGVLDGLFLGLLIGWELFPIVKRHIVKKLKENDNENNR